MFGAHPCSSSISSFIPGLELLILWMTLVRWHEADGHLGIPEKRIDHECVGGRRGSVEVGQSLCNISVVLYQRHGK